MATRTISTGTMRKTTTTGPNPKMRLLPPYLVYSPPLRSQFSSDWHGQPAGRRAGRPHFSFLHIRVSQMAAPAFEPNTGECPSEYGAFCARTTAKAAADACVQGNSRGAVSQQLLRILCRSTVQDYAALSCQNGRVNMVLIWSNIAQPGGADVHLP